MITWNFKWLSDFESPWGIFEKFKYANHCNAYDIFNLFANDYVKKLKGISEESPHRDLLTLNGFDTSAFIVNDQHSLYDYNLNNINRISGFLYKGETCYREHIFFCRECIKNGYHSILFQFKFIHFCPFHQIPLINGCFNCKRKIPYILTNLHTDKPFQCQCGFKWLSDQYNHNSPKISCVKYNENDITDLKVSDWINLSDSQKKLLNNIRLFDERNGQIGKIEYLLSVINHDYRNYYKENHTVLIDIEGIHKNTERRGDISIDYFDLTYKKQESINYRQCIYESNKDILKSIIRKIRNQIKNKHRTCLIREKHFLKEKEKSFPPECPYALAYLHWRKYMQGFYNGYYKVDNRGKIEDVNSLFAFDGGIEICHELLQMWIEKWSFLNYKTLNSFIWLLNQLTGLLTISYFKAFLYMFKNNSNRVFIEHRERYVPYFLIKLPETEKDTTELHYWHESSSYILNLAEKIDCPYDSQSKRRIKSSETNHEPEKLILERMMNR